MVFAYHGSLSVMAALTVMMHPMKSVLSMLVSIKPVPVKPSNAVKVDVVYPERLCVMVANSVHMVKTKLAVMC